MKKHQFKWSTALVYMIAIELIGNLGSLATFSQITTWYLTLNKSPLNPPNWLFGPVWTILFALMGLSLYLVTLKSKNPRRLWGVFALQLGLNVLWSFIFFGWHQPYYAFIEIILLWLAIVATIKLFYQVSKPAAWLLVPYLLWVSFASYLTYSAWILN